MHVDSPALTENAQTMHELCPGVFWNVPAGQLWQMASPVALPYVPGAQAVQFTWPATGTNSPTAQSWHTAPTPPAPTFPGGQFEQLLFVPAY